MQIAPFEIIGYFHLCHWDKDGNLTEVIKRNLVVNVGRDICKERIGRPGTAIKAANWIGLGTGTTAPAAGDTGLAGEITRKEGKNQHQLVASHKLNHPDFCKFF